MRSIVIFIFSMAVLSAATDNETIYRPVAQWVSDSNGRIPPNSTEVGYDGSLLIYVCRTDRHIPGKVTEGHPCYISSEGKELSYQSYQVLTTPYGSTLEWKSANGSNLPSHIVQGGKTDDGVPLYIGRVSHNGAMCSGRVQNGVLYISYGGREYTYNQFDVLIARKC